MVKQGFHVLGFGHWISGVELNRGAIHEEFIDPGSRIKKNLTSVAEPEPVERPLFGGAGAQVFRPGSGSRYVNSYKMLQKVLNFSYKI
jgi:hypothetical protein